MTTRGHASQRIEERFGINLSTDELRDLARRCRKGEGRQERQSDGTYHHALIVRDRVIWVIYQPPSEHIRDPLGVIITAMPPRATERRQQLAGLYACARRARRRSKP